MIKIFLHICTLGEYQKILDELVNNIIESGLLDSANELNICIVGDGFINKISNEKIKYNHVGNIEDFEFPTLQFIEDEINKTDFNFKVLYLNGLGVTNNSNFKISWRKYLSYFNIQCYGECVKALNDYDTCGVDWRTNPVPHYSGNFWWANSNYLKKLPKIQTLNKPNSPIILTLRHNAEMYIGMCSTVNPRVLHQSNISQYERHLYEYPSLNYINKISEENIIKSV